MNSATVAHRWANKDFGKNGTLTASRSCHAEGRNYFSYSTVFGQWVDISKNVVVIFDGSTSVTSSKYKLSKADFPKDVNVFPYDDGGSYYSWHGCNLCGRFGITDDSFTLDRRFALIDYYVECIYNQFAAIYGGKSKGLENVNFGKWEYIEKLCALYKDTCIKKWMSHSVKHEWKNKNKGEDKRKRAMVRLLAAGERDVETITDALFGEGTFKKYWDYCARYRKAADKKAKVKRLAERLGFSNPYEKWHGYNEAGCSFTPKELMNLTAKERVDWHFKNLETIENIKNSSGRDKAYQKRKRNAFLWITGYEPQKNTYWNGDFSYEKDVNECKNMYTGETYVCGGEYITSLWAETSVRFDFDGFRKSEDKEQWIREFYAKCAEVSKNRKAIAILQSVNAHKTQGKYSWEKRYANDDYLRESTDDEQYALCAEFIRKQDKHYADEAARERAREIARIKAEEERRREEEFKKQVKQEQIDACTNRGIEGYRDLWRLHLTDLHEAERAADTDVFFYGGNVLLRFALNNKNIVETSKSIRIPVWVCKKMWKIVKAWHENPKSFKPMEIDTKGSGKYTISSYENDILTAGCHDIAYKEMERMYNEIIAA